MPSPSAPQPQRFYRTARQVSAGGVLIRRRPRLEVCLIRRPGKRRAVIALPKGKLEPRERLHETAVREVGEETGIRGRILKKLGAIQYWYTVSDPPTRYDKTVHFYLMEYVSGSTANHDSEVEEAQWVPLDDAAKQMTYPSERRIVEKAQALLTREVSGPVP